MRKRILKYSIWIVVLLFGVGLYSLNADYLAYTSSLPELELLEAPEDTIPPRYPVAKNYTGGISRYRETITCRFA